LVRRGRAVRDEVDSANQDLAAFDSQDGQQMNKIESLSPDTARAWKWVQENMGEFEQEVYGPPLVSCSIKDQRYTAVVETLMGLGDMLTITAQCQADFKKLQDQLAGKLGLASVTIRSIERPLSSFQQRPLSAEELHRCGLDGWAIDHVDGPEPVLAMLCNLKNFERTAVSLREISEDQFTMLTQSNCHSWVSGQESYRVSKRAEYGPQATSTSAMKVRNPQFWTDRPVDTSARREIEAKIDNLKQSFDEMRAKTRPLRQRLAQINLDRENIKNEIVGGYLIPKMVGD